MSYAGCQGCLRAEIVDAGLIEFDAARRLQAKLHQRVRVASLDAACVVCEHLPVVTVGRAACATSLRVSADEFARRAIPVIGVERGGDVTYHGPGQLVVYPIIDLSRFGHDLRKYLAFLELLIIGMLDEWGVSGTRRTGLRGVWVGDEKIASIGIAVKHWISYYGFAVNIGTQALENFQLIKPCGMDIAVTCVNIHAGRPVAMSEARARALAVVRRGLCG
jgi:lipoate-protein ligase B